ncbi:MAG: flagellar basal body L-ring protein FlgH [Leptospiraceae bacterium]|nr:flagellar basal body L-ring protein FlgH [Leptospiraceae bacterium]MDW7975499.1 hypothetical protein [Leptospiraceae bacterium]
MRFYLIELLFGLFLMLNVSFYFVYHKNSIFFLQAEDLWNGENIYAPNQESYKIGDVILIEFHENLQFHAEFEKGQQKNLSIKLIPDKLLFDFLPDVNDTRSSQKSQNFKKKDQFRFQSKIALKVVNKVGEQLFLEGFRQYQYDQLRYLVGFQAEAHTRFIKNYTIPSNYLSNLVIQVNVVEESNQNLQLEQERIIIDDATKRKIFLEYLRKILEEQNINVP